MLRGTREQFGRINNSYLAFAFGHLGLVSATFLFNVFAAGFLGVEKMGTWQTAMLIATYGVILTLGVINGLGREVPLQRGREDQITVEITISTAILGMLPIFAICAVLGTAGIIRMGENYSAIYLGMIILTARTANMCSRMVLRSFQRFERLGIHQAITGAVLILGLVFLAESPNLTTMAIVISTALGAPLLLSANYLNLRAFSPEKWVFLMRLGLPIMLVGICFALMSTADRILILGLLGVNQLGLYTPALTVFGALFVLPGIVSNIMYPLMARLFGEKGSIEALGPSVHKMIVINYVVSVPVAALLGAAFYLVIIPSYLPEYGASMMPLLILVASTVFLPLGASFGDFFNVVGKQKMYLRNILVGVAANVGVSLVLTGCLGWGLIGVATGTFFGLALYSYLQVTTYCSIWSHRQEIAL